MSHFCATTCPGGGDNLPRSGTSCHEFHGDIQLGRFSIKYMFLVKIYALHTLVYLILMHFIHLFINLLLMLFFNKTNNLNLSFNLLTRKKKCDNVGPMIVIMVILG